MNGATSNLWLALAMLSSPANAQFGGFGGGSSGNPFFGDGSGDDGFGLGFDTNTANRQRTIHGILACLAFVILFPIGAILLRLLPGRWSVRIHWVIQMVAWVMYIVAFALGVVLAMAIRIPGGSGDGSLISNPSTSYHPILGIVVFFMILIQPILGIIHHRQFKRTQQRSISSHLHLWDGRIVIILGIVNGGLGLRLAGATDTAKLAYTIVAAIFGGAYVVLAIVSELRRGRGRNVIGSREERGRSGREVRMDRVRKAAERGSDDVGSGQSRH